VLLAGIWLLEFRPEARCRLVAGRDVNDLGSSLVLRVLPGRTFPRCILCVSGIPASRGSIRCWITGNLGKELRTVRSGPCSCLLRLSRTSTREISAGHGGIAGHLQLKSGQRDLEVGREPGLVSISAGEEVMLGHVALILADVHVIWLGLVTGLDPDLLCHFSSCMDPMTLEGAEDGSEAALLCFKAALQDLDHFSVGWRILEVHVERGRIGCAGSGETSLGSRKVKVIALSP
jgi:hypothetical protein